MCWAFVVAYAVAAAKAFWLAAAKLSARWGAVTAMSKAVGELAKLGTKMSAGRRPEATSRVFAVEGGQSFLFLASGQPRQATKPAGLG